MADVLEPTPVKWLYCFACDEPLAKAIERLRRKPRITRALACAGALAMVTAAVALLI